MIINVHWNLSKRAENSIRDPPNVGTKFYYRYFLWLLLAATPKFAPKRVCKVDEELLEKSSWQYREDLDGKWKRCLDYGILGYCAPQLSILARSFSELDDNNAPIYAIRFLPFEQWCDRMNENCRWKYISGTRNMGRSLGFCWILLILIFTDKNCSQNSCKKRFIDKISTDLITMMIYMNSVFMNEKRQRWMNAIDYLGICESWKFSRLFHFAAMIEPRSFEDAG